MQAANHRSGSKRRLSERPSVARAAATEGCSTEGQDRHIEDGELATGCNKYGSLRKNNLRRKGEIPRPWCHSYEEGELIPCVGANHCFYHDSTKNTRHISNAKLYT